MSCLQSWTMVSPLPRTVVGVIEVIERGNPGKAEGDDGSGSGRFTATHIFYTPVDVYTYTEANTRQRYLVEAELDILIEIEINNTLKYLGIL